MKICVITNSYNRSRELVERSLKASLAQNIQQLIFIDQNATTLPLATDIENDHRFVKIKTDSRCVSEARNQATISSDIDWLIFCDDDGYLAPDYIEKLQNLTTSDPHLQIIAGSIIRDDNNEFYTPRHRIGGDMQKFRFTKLLMGSNFAVRPACFQSLGKFDPNFGAGSYWGSGEETDFAWRAYFAKVPMKYAPELVVFHIKPYAENLSKSTQKSYRYGRGKGALVMKWLLRGKFIVLVELAEMFALPIVQMGISIITLKFRNIPMYFAALFGRAWGMAAFLSKNIRSSDT